MSAGPFTLEQLRPALAPALPASRWWVALSGGLDSMVLLHALAALRRCGTGLPPLAALHVNHQLHPEADHWQQACAALCQALEVPLRSERVQVRPGGRGLEAAAREARHQVFEALLGPGEVLMTAHHQDDQVETLLLRLLRGAGVDGLAAMAATRPLGAGLLHRPLLAFPRAALEHYARERDLVPVQDPSNADTALDRNFLRHQVLPLVARRWPGYRQTVSRAALQLRETGDLLRQQLPSVPARVSALGDPGLALDALRGLAPEAAAAVLRDFLAAHTARPAPDRAALVEFVRQLREAGEGARPRLDCGPMALQRHGDGIYLVPGGANWQAPGHLALAPGAALSIAGVGELGLVPAQQGAGLALAPGEALEVRWRRGGERCRPLGRGGSCSLKQLLQEAQVPPWWRGRLPLLWLGEELLAVGDLWLCESARLRRAGTRWQVRWERNTPAS